MERDMFWQQIENSLQHSEGIYRQEEILINKLSTLEAKAIVNFEIILRQLIIEADDFKVMAALKIIEGYVTDDSYLYFRCWLISQGKKTYYAVLDNPDYLAGKIDKANNCTFEALLYVSTNAFKNKPGKISEDESYPRYVAEQMGFDYDSPNTKTKGIDWIEEELPGLYPQLWSTFHAFKN
jgi:hypothetical protein